MTCSKDDGLFFRPDIIVLSLFVNAVGKSIFISENWKNLQISTQAKIKKKMQRNSSGFRMLQEICFEKAKILKKSGFCPNNSQNGLLVQK